MCAFYIADICYVCVLGHTGVCVCVCALYIADICYVRVLGHTGCGSIFAQVRHV